MRYDMSAPLHSFKICTGWGPSMLETLLGPDAQCHAWKMPAFQEHILPCICSCLPSLCPPGQAGSHWFVCLHRMWWPLWSSSWVQWCRQSSQCLWMCSTALSCSSPRAAMPGSGVVPSCLSKWETSLQSLISFFPKLGRGDGSAVEIGLASLRP